VRSRQLFYWLIFAHGLAVIAIYQIQTTILIKGILIFTLTLFIITAVRRHLLIKGRFVVQEAWVNHDGGWYLLLGNGETLQARLLPDSFINSWLLVLRFKTGRFAGTRSMVLLPDSLDGTVNRNLRIYLRRTAVKREWPD
jgi:hypothetical protein